MERVLRYVDIGRREGARVVAGGERILEETGGYFVPPTIFDNVRNDMTIAREEIFGPVLSVIEFDDGGGGVALANDTPYGLAASLYTDDLNVAHRVARDLKAGVVAVNAYAEGDMTTPFGGYKLSGVRRARQERPRARPVHRDEDDLDPAPAAPTDAGVRGPQEGNLLKSGLPR